MGDNEKRDRITELLEKRHTARKTNFDQLQELKSREISAEEQLSFFEAAFDEKVCEIENSLNTLQAGDGNLMNLFYEIGRSIQELQAYLSNSTLFLNDYTIKKCQSTINELLARLEERKAKLVPRKKFGFKNKPTVALPPPPPPVAEASSNGQDAVDNRTKEESRRHVDYTVANRCRETIVLRGDEVNGKDLVLGHLDRCVVRIEGNPGSVQLSHFANSVVLCGPVSRSLFADNCKNCNIAVACQQLRLHVSKHCDIYLHVTCRAIIEDCSEIRVAPYTFRYDALDEDFCRSGLGRETNNFSDVADFNWLSADQPSPNWRVLGNEEQINDWDAFLERFKCTVANL